MATDHRSGSWMSSRQMAHAAADGRKVAFHWVADPQVVVEGYLVGMDDFHWLLFTSTDFNITLIHKTSPDFAVIEKESSLASQTDHLQMTVEDVGRGFFDYCNKSFLGKKPAPEKESVT